MSFTVSCVLVLDDDGERKALKSLAAKGSYAMGSSLANRRL